MRKSSLHTRRIFAFVATLLVAAQLAACGTVTSSAQSSSQSQSNTIQTPTNTSPSDSYGINKEYLQIYFDIDAETTWDQQTFSAALEAVAGEDAVAIEQEYNALSVIKAAVLSSAYDELVKSYPPNKVNARLENYGITPTTDTDANAYLACGLDAKLFSPDMAKIAVASENFSREDTAALLMSVAEARGNTRKIGSTRLNSSH